MTNGRDRQARGKLKNSEGKVKEKVKDAEIREADIRSVELQLDSVKDAFQRMRKVFVVMTIISTAILFTLWNSNFSRERTMAFGQNFVHKKREEIFGGNNAWVFQIVGCEACTVMERAGMVSTAPPPPCKSSVNEGSAGGQTPVAVATPSAVSPGASPTVSPAVPPSPSPTLAVPSPSPTLRASPAPTPPPAVTPTPPHEYGRSLLLADWYRSRNINVSLLGIHVSISDLPVIGSLTLVVITVWFFYSNRQANRALVTLLRNVNDKYDRKSEIYNMAYQGARNSLLFTRIEESDNPIEQLRLSDEEHKEEDAIEDEGRPGKKSVPRKTFTDRIFRFLTFLPFTTIVAIMARDVIALFMYSPVSGRNLRLGQIMLLERQCSIAMGNDWFTANYSVFLFGLFELVALLCAGYTYRLCRRSGNYYRANRRLVIDFRNRLKKRMDQGEAA